MLNAKEVAKAGGDFIINPLEVGNYPARLVQVIGFGLQPQKNMMTGEAKEPRHVLYTTYELLDEFLQDADGNELTDKPRWVSEEFPLHHLDVDKATSTKRYLALDPNQDHQGDWAALIDTPCNISIVQNEGKGKNAGKIYNNISAVSAMREKDAKKADPLVNKPVIFDPSDPDMEVFNTLPEWMQDKIKSALDFKGSALDVAINGDKPVLEDDDEEDWG